MVQEKTDVSKVSLKAMAVMVREVITVDENALVKEAAETMNKFGIGSIIAVKRSKATGIVTERDLLKRIVAEGKSAKSTRVKEIMSRPLFFIAPDTDVEEAARLMFEKKIKKLAVMDKNRLVGIVSLTDIARSQPMAKFLLKLAALQDAPKNIKKVIDCYVV